MVLSMWSAVINRRRRREAIAFQDEQLDGGSLGVEYWTVEGKSALDVHGEDVVLDAPREMQSAELWSRP